MIFQVFFYCDFFDTFCDSTFMNLSGHLVTTVIMAVL